MPTIPGTVGIRSYAVRRRECPDARVSAVAVAAIQLGAGFQLQHDYVQPGRDGGSFPDQRSDESGSIAPARRVRAEPDLRRFVPETDLERQHGSLSEHAAL